MKIRSLLIVFFSLLFFTAPSHSQDTISAKYFPLAAGNKWIYKRYISPYPPDSVKIEITKDTIIDSHRYFYRSPFGGWVRYDSLSGNLLALAVNDGCSTFPNDKIIDSIPSMPGDVVECKHQSIFTRECLNLNAINLFGIFNIPAKEFEHDGLVYGKVTYAQNFGITYSCSGEPPPCSGYSILKGCVINGVAYGDTVMTVIHNSGNTIPGKFHLSQNYPNPFNPKAIINYQLPKFNLISLTIYDALGKVVAILVNEKQNAGSYEVEFNGENFPSGIYFYKLQTDNFVETKRMILLK